VQPTARLREGRRKGRSEGITDLLVALERLALGCLEVLVEATLARLVEVAGKHRVQLAKTTRSLDVAARAQEEAYTGEGGRRIGQMSWLTQLQHRHVAFEVRRVTPQPVLGRLTTTSWAALLLLPFARP
jgi:hypothetical protein